jgi:Trehalase
VTYLPELEAEHEYWMDGSTVLRGGQGYRRVVRLSDGTILNRYWDDRAEPRDESYREDIATEVQTVRRKLLMTGGVATTLVVSGQQWDHPNGWAPLQWIAVVGLKNYNEAQLAAAIAKRWSCESPLLGVKRTSGVQFVMSAFDPKRTRAGQDCGLTAGIQDLAMSRRLGRRSTHLGGLFGKLAALQRLIGSRRRSRCPRQFRRPDLDPK